VKAEERVLPQIEAARRKGLTTLSAIAAELEALQIKTPLGGTTWDAAQVANTLVRKRESQVVLVFDSLFRRLKRTVHHHRPIHGRRWLRDR
jgi:hypothetical protein